MGGQGSQQCSEDGCAKPVEGFGKCKGHRQRDRRAGRGTAPAWPTDQERFFAKVDLNGPVAKHRPDLGRCHLWLGAKNRGYGICWVRNSTHRAHRVAWEWANNCQVPDGMELDHFACDRTECVNPTHVIPATTRQNTLRSDVTQASINQAKTVCDSGHDFTPENTYITSKGERACKTCKRIDDRERKRRQYERNRQLYGRARGPKKAAS